jgi:HPt (histidine-containing phosphotransfer) domain-containing protein
VFALVDGSSQSVSVETLNPGAIDALLDLLGGDAEALAEVADAFLEEAPLRIAEARAGVEAGDPVLSGRAAHTLKSNALTFGADRLADLSRQLEEAARSGDMALAVGLVAGLGAEWVRTRPLVSDLRDRHTV